MYVLLYDVCASLLDLLHSIWQSPSRPMSQQMAQFHCFLWLSNSLLYVCGTFSLSIPLLIMPLRFWMVCHTAVTGKGVQEQWACCYALCHEQPLQAGVPPTNGLGYMLSEGRLLSIDNEEGRSWDTYILFPSKFINQITHSTTGGEIMEMKREPKTSGIISRTFLQRGNSSPLGSGIKGPRYRKGKDSGPARCIQQK